MMNNDLISIIIPVYNSSKYLAETIESINNQTYQNYEAIFIDDGSNDNSVEIIKKYKLENSRIKIIKLTHQGVSQARNVGIKNANGRFLTFLDSDDIWFKDKLEKQIDFIKKNDYAFVYCNFRYISDDGKKVSKEIKTGSKTDYNRALQDIRILTITAMIDLYKVPKELCYMPNVMNEDVVTWWQILKNGYTAYGQDEVLAYYRKTKNSRSSKKHITAYYRWILYRNFEKLNFGMSLYCFFKYILNAILKRTGGMKNLLEEESQNFEFQIEHNKNQNLQVLISTQNLTNDEQVNQLLNKMNVKSKYLIVNQTDNTKCDIKNSNVITKFEKGLSKSRNIAISQSEEDIVLLADDDLIYNDNYKKIILQSYKKYKNADIICFYVESTNKKRKTKRMISSRIGFIKAMKITSFEISFKRKSIIDNNIIFNEKFGAGTPLNRGEEQIFLYDALKKHLKILFINKKIATAKQEGSSWFTEFNKDFFIIQGKVFKQLSSKFYFILCLQYAVRKYFLYRKNVNFFDALKYMLET